VSDALPAVQLQSATRTEDKSGNSPTYWKRLNASANGNVKLIAATNATTKPLLHRTLLAT